MSAAQRAAIIRETLDWIGTAFHHMGRVKAKHDAAGAITDKGGVDCAQSVYLIYRAALPDRVPEIALEHYAFTWNLSRASAVQERYLNTVLTHAREVRVPEPGDLALFRWGLAYGHGAIVMPPGFPSIAHANANAGFFMLDRADLGRLARRQVKFFTLF